TFELELPPELRARGILPRFHASKLRPYIPNDDIRFPARHQEAIPGFGPADHTAVSSMISHSGKGKDAMFLVQWTTGQQSWEPYAIVRNLTALSDYLEALGVPIHKL
ncbi:hypothetical protein BS47DRAFT_1281130, partial [Hydnum rufescens UP504]